MGQGADVEFHRSHPPGEGTQAMGSEKRDSPAGWSYLVEGLTEYCWGCHPGECCWWQEWGKMPKKSAPMRNLTLYQVSLEEVDYLRRGLP